MMHMGPAGTFAAYAATVPKEAGHYEIGFT